MRALCRDRRCHVGAMWRDKFPSHAPTHGHSFNVKCLSEPILNSQFATSITRSSCFRALIALDSITMAINPATHAHLASIQLSLLLSLDAFGSSFRPLVLGPAQPCLNLPRKFSSGGISSPVLPSTPSLSCTYVPLRVMSRN